VKGRFNTRKIRLKTQETRDTRQEAKDKRKATRHKRDDTRGKRQDTPDCDGVGDQVDGRESRWKEGIMCGQGGQTSTQKGHTRHTEEG
jgi:hypothetical protein